MSGKSELSQTSFPCGHCQKTIFVPLGLPATTAPCPHCGKEVTSPDQSKPAPAEPGSKKETPKQKQPQPTAPPAEPASPNKPKGRGNAPAIIAAAVILLLVGGLTLWLTRKGENDDAPGNKPQISGTPRQQDKGTERDQWLAEGWKEDATETLTAFMTAKTPEQRLKHVIPNEGVEEELEMYYPNGTDDSDTPVQSFGHVTGAKKDRERGIFFMQYRQPAQIDIREYFAPIGSLEAVLGQQEASLLEMAHRIDEDNLSKPIGINAFFKEIDGKLKLDASVFIQGKYRTFKLFTSYPQPGKSKMFRVVTSESLSHHHYNNPGIRTYRLEDYAYPQDFVNVPVTVDSENGKILSQLNWRGLDRERTFKTATVELEWSGEKPSKLGIKRIVCWEFLGVGGHKGNLAPAKAK